MESKTKRSRSQQTKVNTGARNEQEVPRRQNTSHHDSLGARHFFLALIALCLGIVTPPLMSFYQLDYYLEKIEYAVSSGRELFAFSGEKQTSVTPTKDDSIQTQFVECKEENLDLFLYKEEMNPGVHVFCYSDRTMMIYEDSHIPTMTRNIPSWTIILNEVIYGDLMIKPHKISNSQPFAFFSTTGEKIVDEDEFGEHSIPLLKQHGMVLLFEGGNWIWPGVRIGFKRQVDVVSGYSSSHKDHQNSSLEIETLSIKPLVLSVKNFISEKECDHIQKIAEPDMEYSSVSLMDKDKGRPASDFRTSQSAFLVAQDDIMHALEDRTASLTRIPKNHQEHTQVLRYGYSEKYSAHLDWFDPELYQQDPHTLEMIDYGKRNRLATVFWYLSDVEQGGHTVFPRFNGAPQPYNFDDCTKGMKVKPEKGKVIIFYSMLPNGKGDVLSLHGACPVEKGIKWAANKWVWNANMTFVEE